MAQRGTATRATTAPEEDAQNFIRWEHRAFFNRPVNDFENSVVARTYVVVSDTLTTIL